MTEKSITKSIYWHLIRKAGFRVVTHQFNNYYWIADIFAINKSNYTHEIEIKTSKADFMGEFKSIKNIINPPEQLQRQDIGEKNIKHMVYLEDKKELSENEIKYIPNYFSFVVPKEMVLFCQEKLERTPYGLMEAEHHNFKFYFKTILKPKQLHKNKVNTDLIIMLAHRMSYICEKLVAHDI